jgi:hypothetical protein
VSVALSNSSADSWDRNDRDCDRGDDVVASSACGQGYDVAGLRPRHYEVASPLRFGSADSALDSAPLRSG